MAGTETSADLVLLEEARGGAGEQEARGLAQLRVQPGVLRVTDPEAVQGFVGMTETMAGAGIGIGNGIGTGIGTGTGNEAGTGNGCAKDAGAVVVAVDLMLGMLPACQGLH
ncbi:hypothetical protein ABBQ32_010565 [Trebouxia sp. C0010 RCD-2024]